MRSEPPTPVTPPNVPSPSPPVTSQPHFETEISKDNFELTNLSKEKSDTVDLINEGSTTENRQSDTLSPVTPIAKDEPPMTDFNLDNKSATDLEAPFDSPSMKIPSQSSLSRESTEQEKISRTNSVRTANQNSSENFPESEILSNRSKGSKPNTSDSKLRNISGDSKPDTSESKRSGGSWKGSSKIGTQGIPICFKIPFFQHCTISSFKH